MTAALDAKRSELVIIGLGATVHRERGCDLAQAARKVRPITVKQALVYGAGGCVKCFPGETYNETIGRVVR